MLPGGAPSATASTPTSDAKICNILFLCTLFYISGHVPRQSALAPKFIAISRGVAWASGRNRTSLPVRGQSGLQPSVQGRNARFSAAFQAGLGGCLEPKRAHIAYPKLLTLSIKIRCLHYVFNLIYFRVKCDFFSTIA